MLCLVALSQAHYLTIASMHLTCASGVLSLEIVATAVDFDSTGRDVIVTLYGKQGGVLVNTGKELDFHFLEGHNDITQYFTGFDVSTYTQYKVNFTATAGGDLIIVSPSVLTSSVVPSCVTPCAPLCPKSPTSLPPVQNIPGDNTCAKKLNETNVLVQLYQSLGGPNWYNSQNWLVGNPCTNNWYGITCSSNGSINTIDLHNNNLAGPQIPPAIGCLPFLQGLVLDNNFIRGQIPNNFCLLENIQYLTLPNNSLSGVIPPCFSNLIFVKHLYLQGNGLIGSLPEISNYQTLEELHVENNCLGGQIPQSLGIISFIIDLSFANNYFQGCIPDFYQTLVADFTGNYFCSNALPCWLNTTSLGCAPTARTNVYGSTLWCPTTACLSFL